MKTFYKSVQSGCLKCQGGGAPEAIAITVGGIAFVVLLYKIFKRCFRKQEQIHIKTVGKIMFVAGQTLVKLPVTFGIQFPSVVRLRTKCKLL